MIQADVNSPLASALRGRAGSEEFLDWLLAGGPRSLCHTVAVSNSRQNSPITSPPVRVPKPRQTRRSMLVLTERVEPSASSAFTIPTW